MFVKQNWSVEDGNIFQKELYLKRNPDKVEWTTKIINTKKEVLAIKTDTLKTIAKTIKKGDFESFLRLNLNKYHENTIINALLICSIKDFNKQKDFLNKYVDNIDNWASCDTLSFDIKKREEEYFTLAEKYLKSAKPFVRRVGFKLLFEFVENKSYTAKILKIIDSFPFEDEYYVNMIIAWLLAEMFIKNREKTLSYLPNNNLNKFQINKAISKCRDSFRVSKSDKELLLKFRK